MLAKCDNKLFENYVNYAGSKTQQELQVCMHKFENYVNYAGSKTSGLMRA